MKRAAKLKKKSVNPRLPQPTGTQTNRKMSADKVIMPQLLIIN